MHSTITREPIPNVVGFQAIQEYTVYSQALAGIAAAPSSNVRPQALGKLLKRALATTLERPMRQDKARREGSTMQCHDCALLKYYNGGNELLVCSPGCNNF
jgi:hypothetical protein